MKEKWQQRKGGIWRGQFKGAKVEKWGKREVTLYEENMAWGADFAKIDEELKKNEKWPEDRGWCETCISEVGNERGWKMREKTRLEHYSSRGQRLTHYRKTSRWWKTGKEWEWWKSWNSKHGALGNLRPQAKNEEREQKTGELKARVRLEKPREMKKQQTKKRKTRGNSQNLKNRMKQKTKNLENAKIQWKTTRKHGLGLF